MKSKLENWPNKWFGLWKEYGDSYQSFPSIKEFIDPNFKLNNDLNKICRYLSSCQIVATTSKENFNHPFREEVCGAVSYRTDGVWLWLDDLADYVKDYQIAIPNNFLDNLKTNSFEPINWDGDINQLDWPIM